MTAPYLFDQALVRVPAASVVNGLRDGGGPDPDAAGVLREFRAYQQALADAGVSVTELPALEAFPDSVFVEDPALVFTQGAVALRPGAPTRRGEVAMLVDTLSEHFPQVLHIERGYVDGGDVMTTPHGVMIGLSERTNTEGAAELQRCLEALSIRSQLVHTPPGVLHFKSDCSVLDNERILSTRRLAASGVFADFDVVEVPDGEEAAANALRVNDHLLVGEDYARTIDTLDALGFHVVPLPTAEIGKIDAGLSCMSLRWKQAD